MNWLKRISLKKNKALKWLYFIISIACASLFGKPLILCFHRVKIPSDSLLDRRVGVTNPNNLEEIIRFLRITGYQFVSLERLIQMVEEENFAKVVAVTFDDGLHDLYENAFPIMKKHNIPFTCFLITSLIDSMNLLWLHKLYISWDRTDKSIRKDIVKDFIQIDDNMECNDAVAGSIVDYGDRHRLMKLAERLSEAAEISSQDDAQIRRNLYLRRETIEEMQAHGLNIEAHCHNHWPLVRLNEEETRMELESCVMIIREKFESPAQFLALPYGKSNPYLNDIARQLGIRGIFTMQGRFLTARNKDLYNLPRFCIYDNVQAFYRTLSIEFIKYIATKFSKN